MRRMLQGIGIGVGMVLLTAGGASAWGTGTHAYLAGKTGSERPAIELNEIYGGVAPDVFNFIFDYPALLATLTVATHENGAALWDGSLEGAERGLAYGFASHNELWGADRTAHLDGLTFGQGQGYVIAKAAILRDLGLEAALAELQLPEEAKALIAHVLVENAVDLLLAEKYPELGAQLSRAALLRNDAFPMMLAEAYEDLAPAAFIVEVETGYRSNMVGYGQLLQQPPLVAQEWMAALLAQQARGYLGMFGIELPAEYDLQTLAFDGLSGGKELCRADVAEELKATMRLMEKNLEEQGIGYR